MFNKGWIWYCLGNQKKQFTFWKLPYEEEEEVDIYIKEKESSRGKTFHLILNTREPLELLDFRLELAADIDDGATMMANGFQSWSLSEEMSSQDSIKPLFQPARPFLAPYGDCRLHSRSGRRGRIHSWMYTFFRQHDGRVKLFGSVNESPGYTLWEYDYRLKRLVARRECLGAAVNGSFALLDFFVGEGGDDILRRYFSYWPSPRGDGRARRGWSGWPGHFTGISEEMVESNLRYLWRKDIPLDFFQVEHDYRESSGDWLAPGERFPSGMKALAGKIRQYGFTPGLRITPFVCSKKSGLLKSNPGWILRDAKGKPVKAGWSGYLKGWLYALDFFAPGFRDYLETVLRTITGDWGFELLNLDFLYAAALLPREGKARGRIMNEVMDFISSTVPETRLLGSGVPLSASIGRVDYCRTGSDTAPYWENGLLKGINFRERASTVSSLRSALGRFHLDCRAFRNAPGCFMLEDGGFAGANRLDCHQRFTLFFLHNLLGGLVTFSDRVNRYTAEQLKIFRLAVPFREAEIKDMRREGEMWRIYFTAQRRSYLACCNLEERRREVALEAGYYYHPELFLIEGESIIELAPFQTRCLLEVVPRRGRPYLLGATGHIYSGAQIDRLIVRKDSVTLNINSRASEETRVFFIVPPGQVNLKINRVSYPITKRENMLYVPVNPVKDTTCEPGNY